MTDECLESRASFVGSSLSSLQKLSVCFPRIYLYFKLCIEFWKSNIPTLLVRYCRRFDKLAFSKVTNTINHLYGNGVMYIRNWIISGFTKRNGKACQRCINSCSDIDTSQKGKNDNIDIILNKEPGEQLLEMFQLLEKDV